MKSFDYAEPSTLAEASELLHAQAGGACLMAGGTDLMVQMKEHIRAPSQVINLKKIPGLGELTFDPIKGLRIGALVTTRELETSALVLRRYSSLAKAATDFASIQVRNRATLVGNVCRASPSADTLPPLIADGATLHIFGRSGERSCSVEKFCLAPGRTVLAADEIVTRIDIPAPKARTGKAYIKHGRRAQMELATVGVATCITLAADDTLEEVSIVLGAVGPVPLRALGAEAVLRGKKVNESLIEQASVAATSDCTPISDVRASAEYRREMVRVLVVRALQAALKEAHQQ